MEWGDFEPINIDRLAAKQGPITDKDIDFEAPDQLVKSKGVKRQEQAFGILEDSEEVQDLMREAAKRIAEIEEQKIKENLREFYDEETVEWVEEMLEREQHEMLRTWFKNHDIYVRPEFKPSGVVIQKLYIEGSLADVWVL